VFKGADKVLQGVKNQRPIVFVEILRKWCAKFGHTASDVVDLFKSYNYKMYVIRDTDFVSIPEITDETIDTNFVFIPEK
jgi:hypothetical protein